MFILELISPTEGESLYISRVIYKTNYKDTLQAAVKTFHLA